MTPTQKSTVNGILKIIIGACVGALLSAASIGVAIGEDRTEFRQAADLAKSNSERIHKIEIQIAEDRITSRNMLNLLSEVRADVKAIRERTEGGR